MLSPHRPEAKLLPKSKLCGHRSTMPNAPSNEPPQPSHETCWNLVHAAGAGDAAARAAFTQRYQPVVRAYLQARWHATPLLSELDDAAQDVFIECLRVGGALQRATPGRGMGFRAFLLGVVKNVALHAERARARHRERGVIAIDLDALATRDDSSATVFDRAWARAVMREAAELQVLRARAQDAAAERRAEILHLRFHEGLPIREIAKRWGVEAARLHHDYSRARAEFAAALCEVVGEHRVGSAEELDRECARLLSLLRTSGGTGGGEPQQRLTSAKRNDGADS